MRNRFYLPHTATLFFLGTLFTAFLSWICRVYGIGNVQSLLNADGIRWVLRSAISNYVGQPALGIVMILFIGFGIAIYSGIIDACWRMLLHPLSLTRKQRRSLFLSIMTVAIYTIVVLCCTFSPFAILKSVTGTIANSPFLMGIYYIISFGVGLGGIVYGYISGKFRNDKDIIRGMTYLYTNNADYFIILFFIVQFFSSLIYSNMLQSIGFSNNQLNMVYNIFCYIPLIQIFRHYRETKG